MDRSTRRINPDTTPKSNSLTASTEIAATLARLDNYLELAIQRAEEIFGQPPGGDPFRGAVITQEDIQKSIERDFGEPLFLSQKDHPIASSTFSPLCHLKALFGLSEFDIDAIIIALAPELDLRYEKIYAYLHDNISRKQPSIDLILNLLCTSPGEKLAQRSRFSTNSPLLKYGLIKLGSNSLPQEHSFLSVSAKLDEHVTSWLLGHLALSSDLSGCCQLKPIDESSNLVALPQNEYRRLIAQADQSVLNNDLFIAYFCGAKGSGRAKTAEAFAWHYKIPMLKVDMQNLLSSESALPLIRQAVLVSRLSGALLVLEGIDAAFTVEQSLLSFNLGAMLRSHKGLVILAGSAESLCTASLKNIHKVLFLAAPNSSVRANYWTACLKLHKLSGNPQDIETVSQRFQLSPTQIEQAASNIQQFYNQPDASRGYSHIAPASDVPLNDLLSAARNQTQFKLQRLATKVVPLYQWQDLILPEQTLAPLRELCARELQRQRVLTDWGFAEKISGGKGTTALFSGPPGTGKSMAAEVIASTLGVDIYRIDLAHIVDKYIGETEKNLDAIFTEAEHCSAVLLFDEADSLFSKRTEVNSAHDSYANIKVSYLLQKMESFNGLAILTTNLRENIDEAFQRRLSFSVYFAFPEEVQRLRLWETVWPRNIPLDENVDFSLLAKELKIGGGNIKNIAIAAAYLAAAEDSKIGMRHLLGAAQREYEKIGKTFNKQLTSTIAGVIQPRQG